MWGSTYMPGYGQNYDEYQTFDFKIQFTPLGGGQYKMQGWVRMHAAASCDEMWYLNWPYKWQWNKAINNVANPEDAWLKIGGHQPDGGERIISGCDFSMVYPYISIANWGTTQTQYHFISWERIAVEGTPATPPPEMWVDDNWTGLPNGTEVQPGKFIGYNAFALIQDAINAANPGTLIWVYDGIYNENLVIGKTLTVQSASHPIIDGGAAGDCISVTANNVVVNGFEIRNGYNGIIGQTSGSTFSNNVIHDNLNIPGSAGVGILLWGDNDNNIIAHNEIYDNDRQGIFVGYYDTTKISTGNIITDNTIYNNGLYRNPLLGPDASEYGIQLWTADSNIIENNEIYNHDDWFPYGTTFDFAQGIYLCDSNNNLITGNNLHGNNYGVGLWHPTRAVVTNYINYNDIWANTGYGVRTFDGPPLVDARFNWWGHASGPTHSSNPGGTGDTISNNVDYSPWLGLVVGTAPMTYHVNPTGLPGAIQEAVDEASDGDTVIAHEGTYPEQVLINKNLALKGLTGAKIVAPDTRSTYTVAESTGIWDPLIFAYGGTMVSNAVSGTGTIDVTISGFEIDGLNKAGLSPKRFVAILCRNVKPGLVNGTYIHQMFDPDGQGNGPETFGIMCYGDSLVTIKDNEVRDFSRGGIGITGDDGPLPDPTTHVQGNIVVGNGLEAGSGWWAENGIQVSYGAGGNITGNNVVNCQVNNPSWVATGIIVYDAATGVRILANSVEDCDVGISVISPSYDVIEGNSITGCNWEGIGLGWPVDHCTVTNNTVTDSWAGIGVWDASENLIKYNTLENNEYGIIMDGDSDNNAITRNHIINNTVDGIYIEPYDGNDPSGTQVHYNCIVGNGDYGVYKDGAEVVNATHNWWGDSFGPYHPSKNPDGLGDEVSDNVLFEPWMKAYFEYSRSNPVVGELVTFDATLSTKPCNVRTVASYTWNFADGNTTATPNPIIIHSFTGPGTHNVTLTLTYDDAATATEWALIYVSKMPCLKVVPEELNGKLLGSTWQVNITISDLDVAQGFVGCQFRLGYNTTLLEVVNATAGDFISDPRWNKHGIFLAYYVEKPFNHIVVGLLIFPNATGKWDAFPYGNGTLVTINFKVIHQERGYDKGLGWLKPPETCDLPLFDTRIINNEREWIPHTTKDGGYIIWPTNIADVNYDGYVGIDDLFLVASSFGEEPGRPRWNALFDLNNDSYVGVDDIWTTAYNFGWEVDC